MRKLFITGKIMGGEFVSVKIMGEDLELVEMLREYAPRWPLRSIGVPREPKAGRG